MPIGARATRALAGGLALTTIAFTVGFYDYYRGSVVTPFHGGPVSPAEHHLVLSAGRLAADGEVSVHAYVDGGTSAVPAHLMSVSLRDGAGRVVEASGFRCLSRAARGAIKNSFAYQRFSTDRFGITAALGAASEIALPPARHGLSLASGRYRLVVTDVDGHDFGAVLELPPGSAAAAPQ